jgi:hypothetical protein
MRVLKSNLVALRTPSSKFVILRHSFISPSCHPWSPVVLFTVVRCKHSERARYYVLMIVSTNSSSSIGGAHTH